MKRSFRAFVATLLLVTPLLASCGDAARSISAPPEVERQELLGLVGGVVNLLGDVVKGLVGIVVGGADANADATSKYIDEDGGTLRTGPYTLIVPAGAVSNSTLFKISPTNTGTYSLDLSATRKTWRGTVDVGGQGFDGPVTVKISYAGADNLKDPSKLVIVYVTPRGETETQLSKIDFANKVVSSQLGHFSKYALVQN